jgi:histidine triad (HIT) family protein
MPSVFTKIINGEIPSHKLLEDKDYLAFLDVRAINPGHALVITKKEIDYIFDVDDQLLAGLMVFAKKVAKMIKKEVSCKKIGVMVAGLEVPHVHIHLVPIMDVHDLNFAKSKPADPKDLVALAERIRGHKID